MTKNRKLSKKIELRCSDYEKIRIKWLADKYAGGNISLWLIYAAINAPRKKIDQSDIRHSTRKI